MTGAVVSSILAVFETLSTVGSASNVYATIDIASANGASAFSQGFTSNSLVPVIRVGAWERREPE